jgi:hypothetical protein
VGAEIELMAAEIVSIVASAGSLLTNGCAKSGDEGGGGSTSISEGGNLKATKDPSRGCRTREKGVKVLMRGGDTSRATPK